MLREYGDMIAVQVLTSGFQRTTKTTCTDAENLDTGELLLNGRTSSCSRVYDMNRQH